MKSNVRLKVWGDWACFTRPEMKVERVSYEIMTPSAARGILEAIYWKPQMHWIIDKIYVINDINFINIGRNEVSQKASSNSVIIIENKRQQRASRILKNVVYVIDAHIETNDPSEIITKHVEIFERRARKGQCFQQPYLGCREFPASFELLDKNHSINNTIDMTADLGLMLHDIDHTDKMKPYFFNAKLEKGIMNIPLWKYRKKNSTPIENTGHTVKMSVLNALYDYYKLMENTADMPPPGYAYEGVSFIIEITKNGKLDQIYNISDDKNKSEFMMIPTLKRSRNLKSKFLSDNIAYVFGIPADRVAAEKHRLFVELHKSLLKDAKHTALKAFKLFLDSFEPIDLYNACKKSHIEKKEFIDNTSNIVFKIKDGDDLLHNLSEAKKIWSTYTLDENSIMKNDATCLITGTRGIVARLHPPIKGVAGALPTGSNIISFNNDSFESYGMKQGENSSISPFAAHAYVTAVNHIIRNNKMVMGDVTMLYWSYSTGSFQHKLLEMIGHTPSENNKNTEPNMQQNKELKKLLLQTKRGIFPEKEIRKIMKNNDEISYKTPCYILGFKQNRARLFVSFWLPLTLKKLFEAVKQHNEDLRLEPIPQDWIDRAMPINYLLKLALTSSKSKENIHSTMTASVIRAIFNGSRYPYSLLYMILARIRADHNISWVRTLFIRAYIVRYERFKTANITKHGSDYMMALDESEVNSGYRLGRLFAVLEKIQKDAINPGANITVKYFASASSTPSRTFPTLIRTAHYHMSTLAKNEAKKGIVIWLDKMLNEIISGLDTSMPKTLNIVDQGRFAIGYYHQKHSFYIKKDTSKSINNSQLDDE
ncbi:MAG: CRISPR-associated protein, Csd1 family [Cenarchaeum symbiont of Oopsacas minuta]|nr:CRISPR-associated protein, Csd1 family [Cenarchaeum symbiont of Oopsacas minuta]